MRLPRFERSASWRLWLLLLALVAIAIRIPEWSGRWSEPAANGSLLEDGAILASGAMGIPDQVLRGPLPAEGSHWRLTDRVLVLGNPGGWLAVDLGRPVDVRALLVQGNAANRFDVEGSLDGVAWRVLWEVPFSRQGTGLRTRHHRLDPPESLRWLRIRNRTLEGVAALGALRAHAELPAGWPLWGAAQPGPIADFPWFTLESVYRAKLAVAVVGALLLIAAWRLERTRARRATLARAVDVALAVAAGVAALGWWNFLQISSQTYAQSYNNYWDIQHYYLGAKYAPELGYTRLYHCMLAADVADGLREVRLQEPWTRDLASNAYVPTPRILDAPGACTDHFEAQRWQAFRHDQAKLRSLMPPGRQLEMQHDHGYNASPVWGIAGRAVGALGPLDDTRLAFAIALDPVLLVLAFAAIATTFGFRATCAALILFGTSYSFGNWVTAGAFLRFDWLAASVFGVCCLKRERWLAAGLWLAFATSLRLFPGFLIGGVALHALLGMLRERSPLPAPRMRRFAAGVVAGGIACVGLSLPISGGAEAWRGFVDNSLKHKATTAVTNLGFDALTGLFHDSQVEGHERFRASGGDVRAAPVNRPKQLLWLGVAAATLALLARAARREEPWVCAVLGLCWLAFASDVGFYYYSVAILFALLLTRAPGLTLPFALLVVAWAATGVLFDYTDFYLYGWSSVALVIFSLSALSLFASGRTLPPPRPPTA